MLGIFDGNGDGNAAGGRRPREASRGGVPEVVEPDAAETRAAEESGEGSGEVCGGDRPVGGRGELATGGGGLVALRCDGRGRPSRPVSAPGDGGENLREALGHAGRGEAEGEGAEGEAIAHADG
jgi:hypothetical protein